MKNVFFDFGSLKEYMEWLVLFLKKKFVSMPGVENHARVFSLKIFIYHLFLYLFKVNWEKLCSRIFFYKFSS